MSSAGRTYEAAGVSLAAAEEVVGRLRAAVESTGAQGFGAFAGLHPLGDGRYLAASTDGVGTKLILARQRGRLRDCGADLAAHCITDVATCGAEPLMLLDYVASKGGVVGVTRALAKEVGPDGVTVNAIAPGAFPTDAEKIHPNPQQYDKWVLDQQSIKRRGGPQDIGNLVVFLASDASSFITGQTIVIDGGWGVH